MNNKTQAKAVVGENKKKRVDCANRNLLGVASFNTHKKRVNESDENNDGKKRKREKRKKQV